MEFLINGEMVDESDMTPEQWEMLYEAESAYEQFREGQYVDPMEIEEPTLAMISEGGFDNEFVRDCD